MDTFIKNQAKEIKCVVWDLDNTIWNGILVEDQKVVLRKEILNILRNLDSRGILNSIASKNNYSDAIKKLEEFGILDYFIYPEIHWNPKSLSIKNIQKNINIAMDTLMFVDDQIFERDEVRSAYIEVECINPSNLSDFLDHPRLNPRFITSDSKNRRKMYQDDINRNHEEEDYQGTPEDFLKSLDMNFIISEAYEDDLKRAEELTVRTHQLNATGLTFDYDELVILSKSDDHILLICELTDKYGSYGKIGLSLIEKKQDYWHVKLLLMSCRVMSRGVGTVLLTFLMNKAKKNGKKILADFQRTERNKQMYITYKFANFTEKYSENNQIIFENDLSFIQDFPKYIKLFDNTKL